MTCKTGLTPDSFSRSFIFRAPNQVGGISIELPAELDEQLPGADSKDGQEIRSPPYTRHTITQEALDAPEVGMEIGTPMTAACSYPFLARRWQLQEFVQLHDGVAGLWSVEF